MSEWHPPRSILYATDFSEPAVRAGEVARELARRFDSRLAVIHAVDVPPMVMTYASDVEVDVAGRDVALGWLEELRSEWESEGLVVGTHSRIGSATDVLVEAADERGSDLIVLGTHGRAGIDRLFLGSVAEGVVRRAHCSVLTVEGSGAPADPRSIVVGIDLSEWSEYTLRAAGRLALGSGAHLHVVHVLEHRPSFPASIEEHVADNILELAREGAATRLTDLVAHYAPGIDTSIEICDGVIYEALTERAAAHRADLMVVGTHGHRGFARGVMGGVAERTLRGAPCSVWTVRPPLELARARATLGGIANETVLTPAT